jgi:hypothetical protein
MLLAFGGAGYALLHWHRRRDRRHRARLQQTRCLLATARPGATASVRAPTVLYFHPYADVAQSVEQLMIRNQQVGGSIPLADTNKINKLDHYCHRFDPPLGTLAGH